MHLHRRLGYRGQAALQRFLHNSMATCMDQISGTSISPCDPYHLGKLTRPHPAVAFNHNRTYALELVVMDLAGPVKPRSLRGASYFLGILDVFMLHFRVFPIKKNMTQLQK